MATVREILAMLSVQSPGGLVFGTARRIDGSTLGFELDARMQPGDVVEWRMELPGLDETAMGTLRVTAAGKQDVLPTWTGTILSVAPDDAEVFEVWRRGVEQGTRAFSHTSKANADSWLSATTMVGSNEAERKQAVAAQEERRRRRLERAKTLAKNARTWPDPTDTESGKAVAASGAFRSQLSGSVSRTAGAGSAGSAFPDTNERPRLAIAAALRGRLGAELGGALPVAAVPAPVSVPPASIGVTVHVDRGMASIGFDDAAAYRRVHMSSLLAGSLVLPRTDFGAEGARLSVWLRLPSGATVPTTATVRRVVDGQTELSVDVSIPSRRLVEMG